MIVRSISIFLLLLATSAPAASHSSKKQCSELLSLPKLLREKVQEVSPRFAAVLESPIAARMDRAIHQSPVLKYVTDSIALCRPGKVCKIDSNHQNVQQNPPFQFELTVLSENGTLTVEVPFLAPPNQNVLDPEMLEQSSTINPTLMYFTVSVLRGISQFVKLHPDDVTRVKIIAKDVVNSHLSKVLLSLGLEFQSAQSTSGDLKRRLTGKTIMGVALVQFLASLAWNIQLPADATLLQEVVATCFPSTCVLTLIPGVYLVLKSQKVGADYVLDLDLSSELGTTNVGLH